MRINIRPLSSGVIVVLTLSAAIAAWAGSATSATTAAAQPATTVTRPALPSSPPVTRPLARAATQTLVTGALVWIDDSGSPYYAAGLRSGDLVTKGNEKPIRNDGDFYKVFAATTDTAQIRAEGLRDGKPFTATVQNYLPADVKVSGYLWDWARYLKYYAPDPANPDPLLRRAYEHFDRGAYAQAQIEFTSATKAGHKDPLTTAKVAWLLLRGRSADSKAGADTAGKMLEQAIEAFDASKGDKETQSKLEGTYMLYCKTVGNIPQAGLHGRKAVDLAPQIIGNRINYYVMLEEAKQFDEAAMAADALAMEYPQSVYFQRLRKTANLRIDRLTGAVSACEALVRIMPDDIPSRMQLLPFLDQIRDNYNLPIHCDYLTRVKEKQLTDPQRGEINYYLANLSYRRQLYREAESRARDATRLRGSAEDYFLLGNIMYTRSKWSDAVVAYSEARRRNWSTAVRGNFREQIRDLQKRMDESIDHLWGWQVKRLPKNIQPEVQRRKQWLAERAVLKQSYVIRNRYGIRNVLIAIGAMMIVTGLVMRVMVSQD